MIDLNNWLTLNRNQSLIAFQKSNIDHVVSSLNSLTLKQAISEKTKTLLPQSELDKV